MRALDLMTTDVATLAPNAPLQVVTGMMAEHSLTGLPVVDGSRWLLGLVTGSDLLHRLANTEQPQHGYLWGIFHSISRQADDYARLHGQLAADVMTLGENLVTATEDTTAEQAARLMEEQRIRHMPVVRDGGTLVGMIPCANLLHAALKLPEHRKSNAPDNVIRREVIKAMRRQPWADTHSTFVDVKDGVVTFSGFVRDEHVKRGLRAVVEEVAGVREVVFETQATPAFWIGGP